MSLRHRAGKLGYGSAKDSVLTLPSRKGEISLAGVLPLAGVGGSARTRVIVVVVVVVVVEYIIILIIIIVVLLDFAELQLCQTVHLESSLFFKPLIFPRKVMGRQIEPFVVGSFSYGLQGRI